MRGGSLTSAALVAVLNKLPPLPEDVTASKVFESALTHRSAGKDNNERLEFLGDAVLGLVIAQILFEKFPTASEGDLSRLRAHLVCKRALAEIAKQVGLSDVLKLGSGERRTGGHYRSSILADSLEAIIAAVYQIKGFEYAAQFIAQLYTEQMQKLPDMDELKDPKTRLQEYLQAQQIEVPDYTLSKEWGEGNDKHFQVECSVTALSQAASGEGKSKKKAEQAAASALLTRLQSK